MTQSCEVASAACVHLVTILYNSGDGISDFLDCLQAQQPAENWHLHVIDNASTDGALALVEARADPRISIQRNATNLGFATAANQGIRAALAQNAAFVVLINNDTSFLPDFLQRFAQARDTLDAGVIAPRIMRRDEPEAPWYAGGRLVLWLGLYNSA